MNNARANQVNAPDVYPFKRQRLSCLHHLQSHCYDHSIVDYVVVWHNLLSFFAHFGHINLFWESFSVPKSTLNSLLQFLLLFPVTACKSEYQIVSTPFFIVVLCLVHITLYYDQLRTTPFDRIVFWCDLIIFPKGPSGNHIPRLISVRLCPSFTISTYAPFFLILFESPGAELRSWTLVHFKTDLS